MSTSPTANQTPAARLSPSPTMNNDQEAQSHEEVSISKFRKWFLLFVFSLAQFLDIFAASSVVLALGPIARATGMKPSEEVWVVNAYALVLSATLLTGGRVADIFSSKWTFIAGFTALGVFNILLGFVTNLNGFLFLRAVSAFGASLTIPAAVNLIIHLFPDPKEQAIAIALFGGSGAIANILGLVIGGALLVADYTWIFFFMAIIALPFSLLCVFIIPKPKEAVFVDETAAGKEGHVVARKAKFDWGGTFFQIAGIALLVYGLTSSNTKGWKEAGTISTVIIGVLLIGVFFWWETRVHPIDALIRPAIWKIPGFTQITIFALGLAFWYFASQVSLSIILQQQWVPTESAIMTAVRFLPSSIAGVIAMVIASAIPLSKVSLKMRLIVGPLVSGAAMILFAFSFTRADYWPKIFTGFVLGSAFQSAAFVGAYVSFLQSVPPEVSGVAGAIIQSAAQLGVAALIAIQTTIQVAYPANPGPSLPSAKGYKYGFIFCACVMWAEMIMIIVFFKNDKSISPEVEEKLKADVGANEAVPAKTIADDKA